MHRQVHDAPSLRRTPGYEGSTAGSPDGFNIDSGGGGGDIADPVEGAVHCVVGVDQETGVLPRHINVDRSMRTVVLREEGRGGGGVEG